jgi:hypothetical protein
MTGARLQIRTEQHGQAPALTTAVLPQRGHRPFRARTRRTTPNPLLGMLATLTLSCPSRLPSYPQLPHPAGRLTPSCPPVTRPRPRCHAADLADHIMPVPEQRPPRSDQNTQSTRSAAICACRHCGSATPRDWLASGHIRGLEGCSSLEQRDRIDHCRQVRVRQARGAGDGAAATAGWSGVAGVP